VLLALISQTGSVSKVSTIRGKTALAGAATKAVRQWRYRPYEDHGKPIDVRTRITFNFHLTPPPELKITAQPGKTPQAGNVNASPTNNVVSSTPPEPAPLSLGKMPSVPDIKVYSARDGASKPIVIYQPSANYTEQASKARLEGPVVLRIVVKTTAQSAMWSCCTGLAWDWTKPPWQQFALGDSSLALRMATGCRKNGSNAKLYTATLIIFAELPSYRNFSMC